LIALPLPSGICRPEPVRIGYDRDRSRQRTPRQHKRFGCFPQRSVALGIALCDSRGRRFKSCPRYQLQARIPLGSEPESIPDLIRSSQSHHKVGTEHRPTAHPRGEHGTSTDVMERLGTSCPPTWHEDRDDTDQRTGSAVEHRGTRRVSRRPDHDDLRLARGRQGAVRCPRRAPCEVHCQRRPGVDRRAARVSARAASRWALI